MATFQVRVFELPAVMPASPLEQPKPKEVPGFRVDALNHDLAKRAVYTRLGEYGYKKVRSVSFGAEAPNSVAAVVHAKE